MTPSETAAAPQSAVRSRPPGDWTSAFTPGRLALLIVSLLFVEYPEVMLGSHSFFNSDFGLFTCPVAQYTRASLWRGEIPLWNPLNNCGAPFLAQWNTTVSYPLSWIYILFPLPWSLNYFCLGHLVLGGLGMYWLAWRWTANRFAASVAGLAFGLNGLTFNCLMWTSNLAALSWMPLTMLCVERAWRGGGRRLVPAALAGAMQMLAGAPEIVFLTWVMLGTLWLGQVWQPTVRFSVSGPRFALVVVLVCGLAAVQLLPFLELLPLSDRDPGQNPGAWSLPAWGWANFIVPLFRCSRSILGPYFEAHQQWTSSYYLGIGVLALALAGVCQLKTPRIWWLMTAALGGFLLALGDNGFLYPLITRLFPAFGLARYPIKFIVPTVLALPLLAAFGIHGILRDTEGTNHASRLKTLLWPGIFLLAVLALILAVSRFFPYPEESWQVTLINGSERAVFLMLTLGGVSLLATSALPARRSWLGLGILVMLGLDALTHVPRQNPTVSVKAYGPIPLGMSSLPRLGQSRAMVSPLMQALMQQAATPDPFVYYVNMRRSLYEDCNLLADLPKLNGFFSLHLREESAVEALLYNPTNFPSGLADFLGVSQISSPEAWFEWAPRNTSLAYATAGQQPIFAVAAETLRGLASPGFNPRRTVYLPLEARELVTATNAVVAEITRWQFSAHEVTLEVAAAQPALVVLAQAFFPAWRARVDNQPARIWRANHAFQALEVPAGHHQVRLVYQDYWFYAGAASSVVTLLACLGFQLRLGAKRKRQGTPPLGGREY